MKPLKNNVKQARQLMVVVETRKREIPSLTLMFGESAIVVSFCSLVVVIFVVVDAVVSLL